MADATRNKLSAQIIKAEMLGDTKKVSRLKQELVNLPKIPRFDSADGKPKESSLEQQARPARRQTAIQPNSRIKKFLDSTSSLETMFAHEKNTTASDEAKIYMKTSAKFARDDMETKYFSEEMDDSQTVLNRSKRHKPDRPIVEGSIDLTKGHEACNFCVERLAKHLQVDTMEFTYMKLMNGKSFLSSMSNVVILNKDHSCCSFVSSSPDHQQETERMIDRLREMWKAKGYRTIIMESFFKNRRPSHNEFASCGNHYQVHCLPLKEKHYERARMSFKQALLGCEKEWSMNKKLITTDGRRIQRYIPRGLSYFWVCFDELTNGFGHVIESEPEFSRYFGLEILSGLLDKDFNPMRLNQDETFKEQFARSHDFKLLYWEQRQEIK